MIRLKLVSRFGMMGIAAAVVLLLTLVSWPAQPTHAALLENGGGPQVLIALDDDRQDNPAVQAGAVANQSLGRTDVLLGGSGNDVMFGLNGSDVMDGGPGRDIILGGPDGGGSVGGGPPNSDIMFGGNGNDVNLWAPGDGSEAFIGGNGTDAIIFGQTDRDTVADPTSGVRLPLLRQGVPGFGQGIPTADVSGLVNNFCSIESSPLPGYDFFVRFRNAAGIIVTVRVRDVEQVFCPEAGQIVFADLKQSIPAFSPVSPDEIEKLNGLVAAMIR